MFITYSIGDEHLGIDVDADDDFRSLLLAVERALSERHPELAGRENLAVDIADALLNSLADDCEVARLGDLGAVTGGQPGPQTELPDQAPSPPTTLPSATNPPR